MVPKTYIPPYSWNIILYNHYIFQKVYQCLIIKGFNYLIMSRHNEKFPWILFLWTPSQSSSQIGNILPLLHRFLWIHEVPLAFYLVFSLLIDDKESIHCSTVPSSTFSTLCSTSLVVGFFIQTPGIYSLGRLRSEQLD